MGMYKITTKEEIEKTIYSGVGRQTLLQQREWTPDRIVSDSKHFWSYCYELESCLRIPVDSTYIDKVLEEKTVLTLKDMVDIFYEFLQKYGSMTEEEWYANE